MKWVRLIIEKAADVVWLILVVFLFLYILIGLFIVWRSNRAR